MMSKRSFASPTTADLARLKAPAGTVVSVEGDLEARYRAAGWTDVDAPVEQQDEAAPEKPQRKRRTISKE